MLHLDCKFKSGIKITVFVLNVGINHKYLLKFHIFTVVHLEAKWVDEP